MKQELTLVINPNPRLRERSRELELKEISSLINFAQDMSEAMIVHDGVGLAAPQIGHNIRLIIINTPSGPQAMFNPQITKKSWLKKWGEEGCLSVPNTFGDVKRHKKITCSFIDLTGEKKVVEAVDMMARIIQHEIDHLDGILFIDKAKNIHTV